MRRTSRPGPRGRTVARNQDYLPEGVGGTITGGPRRPIDLMAILSRGAGSVSRGGAVSGAAQVAVSSTGAGGGQERGVALSDGSRICFASVGDPGVVRQDEQEPIRGGHVRHLAEV